jgi:hypothetical protein
MTTKTEAVSDRVIHNAGRHVSSPKDNTIMLSIGRVGVATIFANPIPRTVAGD